MSTQHNNISADPPSRKVGLSCAECRRSKLKCDRIFPCQSCIRRGCSNICPEGTLNATKGNKVLMAHAQRLTEQVKMLSQRVQELEAALVESSKLQEVSIQSSVSAEDENSAPSRTSQVGRVSTKEPLQIHNLQESPPSRRTADRASRTNEISDPIRTTSFPFLDMPLPPDLTALVHAFPFGFYAAGDSISTIYSYLPNHQRARELVAIYYSRSAHLCQPITQEDFIHIIFQPVYGDNAPHRNGIHPHVLSILFSTFAIAVLYEPDQHRRVVHQYHFLARASTSAAPFLQDISYLTMLALFFIVQLVHLLDKSNHEEIWMLSGLCARVAQSLGLQRENSTGLFQQSETQRRRRLFWEFFSWETWTGLVCGRPPALLIQYSDAQIPDDAETFLLPTGEKEFGWHSWKYQYSATCLSNSILHLSSTNSPSYGTLLQIDQEIRNFPVPSHLWPTSTVQENSLFTWSQLATRASQQYGVLCVKEANILYLHRKPFSQALKESPQNPLSHNFGPSVLSVYTSARKLIYGFQSIHTTHLQQSPHPWYFWQVSQTAYILLAELVIQSPACSLSEYALKALECTQGIYEVLNPGTSLSLLKDLIRKASNTFNVYKNPAETSYSTLGSRSHLNQFPLQAQSSRSPPVDPGSGNTMLSLLKANMLPVSSMRPSTNHDNQRLRNEVAGNCAGTGNSQFLAVSQNYVGSPNHRISQSFPDPYSAGRRPQDGWNDP